MHASDKMANCNVFDFRITFLKFIALQQTNFLSSCTYTCVHMHLYIIISIVHNYFIGFRLLLYWLLKLFKRSNFIFHEYNILKRYELIFCSFIYVNFCFTNTFSTSKVYVSVYRKMNYRLQIS